MPADSPERNGRPRGYRTYTDSERAAVLVVADACGSYTQAAKQCHVPVRTVTSWAALPRPDVEAQRAEARQLLADLFGNLAQRAVRLTADTLDRLDPDDLTASDARALAVVAGIATDKQQLLHGDPTSIHQQRLEQVQALPVSVLEQIESLMLAAQADAPPDGAEGVGGAISYRETPPTPRADVPTNATDQKGDPADPAGGR